MTLTIDESRYQQIKAEIEVHRAPAETFKVDRDRQSAFTNVDEFLIYLEKNPVAKDRAKRFRRKR